MAAWVLYFSAIAIVVGFFAGSVVKTLRGRARRAPPAATSAIPTRATLRVCMDDLDALFVEFRPFIGHCRFANCRHASEPGCAIAGAVKDGLISERRRASYRQILSGLRH